MGVVRHGEAAVDLHHVFVELAVRLADERERLDGVGGVDDSSVRDEAAVGDLDPDDDRADPDEAVGSDDCVVDNRLESCGFFAFAMRSIALAERSDSAAARSPSGVAWTSRSIQRSSSSLGSEMSGSRDGTSPMEDTRSTSQFK